ncbi:MAG: DUF3841 domain-containing protein [Clostridium sp.]
MKLWTIQNEAVYDKFKQSGVLHGDEKFIDEDMIFYYSWIADIMKKRIGLPILKNIKYPIWAWYQWGGSKRKRPDLRCSGYLEKGTKGVLLELEVDSKNVLLSDFLEFNDVLNYGYITDTEKAYDRFYSDLESYGYSHHDLQNANINCDIFKKFNLKLIKSWEKIFDLNRNVDEEWGGKRDNRPIQATMWEIKWEQVVSVKHFIAK